MTKIDWGKILQKVSTNIRKHEGLKLKPYKDGRGNLTIGYGHNLRYGIPLAIARDLMRYDMYNAKRELEHHLRSTLQYNLSNDGWAFLVELCFWIGIEDVLSFKEMLYCLECSNIKKAVAEFKDSKLYRNYPSRCNDLIPLLKNALNFS